MFIHTLGISFEDTDKVLLSVFKLRNCSYNNFLDKMLNYLSDDSGEEDYKNICSLAR